MNTDLSINLYFTFTDFKINFYPHSLKKQLVGLGVSYLDYLEHLFTMYEDVYGLYENKGTKLQDLSKLIEDYESNIIDLDFIKNETLVDDNDDILQQQKMFILKEIVSILESSEDVNKFKFILKSNIVKETFSFSEINMKNVEILSTNFTELLDENRMILKEITEIKLFLREEIIKESEKQNIETELIRLPESDFSDNEDKVKLIILEKLGIINYIKSIQIRPDTITHTAEILASFTGIKSRTLYSYLRPMISSVRDNSDKNSPYNILENEVKADKQLTSFKTKDVNK
ncbi:hypothetical protein [Chryseobacterium lathyri]|uniref:Chromosome segregation and condensation protein ScpA n=1 Tax=Chryseobacterium lathyri TaxID=395933 RepID=A0ABT9SQL5_9FLAO|nr:hypothetical protein [Chryseobacterium lathyri]MDP9961272.1 hypothetical protein [Chryseobacterium lathyri]